MDLYFHGLQAFEFVFWYSDSAEGSLQAQPVFTFKEEEESNQMCTKVKSESDFYKLSGSVLVCLFTKWVCCNAGKNRTFLMKKD